MSEGYRQHLYIGRVENGQHSATPEDFPGLVVQGRTVAETVKIAQDVARKLIESYRIPGDALPDGLMPIVLEALLKDLQTIIRACLTLPYVQCLD